MKEFSSQRSGRARGSRSVQAQNYARPPLRIRKTPWNMAKQPTKPEPAGSMIQLKVTLGGSRPSIWRRLLVPADIKLSKLHAVLQIGMGWEESHLHSFRHEDMTYEPVAHQKLGGGLFAPEENQDEAKVRLVDLLDSEGDWLIYEYDFGDGWQHEIRVEKIVPVGLAGAHRAICLAGARACPPEDCGGLPGYDRLLKIIANPKHPEHGETLEWLGDSFDPAAFDAARVDAALLKLKL